jgi:nicotinamide-nucleotide amidase
MRVEVVFTGTELLIGQIVNTHADFLGRELAGLGIEVVRYTTVGDDRKELESAIREALSRADLVITTGGLGPTTDDLTMSAVASVLGLPLVLNQRALTSIKEFFNRLGKAVPDNIVRQAYFPEGATVLPNGTGTAPGCFVETGQKAVVVLPGPPRELVPMFTKYVLPILKQRTARDYVVRFRVIRVTGIAEYAVQERLKDLGIDGNPGIGYIVKPGEVHIRITAKGRDAAAADRMVAGMISEVQGRLRDYVFAFDDEEIEKVVGDLLARAGYSIALAESCTGGLAAARLTDIPGSSKYFQGCVVAYNNSLKQKCLGVPEEVLRRKGAVSPETAAAMAEGVKAVARADMGIGITGIAGPGGGTPEKPVGLVYVALAAPRGTESRGFNFPGGRNAVRQGAVNAAFKMVRAFLEDELKKSPDFSRIQ